jgi:hypothetical protein
MFQAIRLKPLWQLSSLISPNVSPFPLVSTQA